MQVIVLLLVSTIGFEFLSVDPVAHRSGMGHALYGDGYDVHYNPAGLALSEKTYYSASYLNYFAGTHFGYLGYARQQIGAGIRYFNSGSMNLTDSLGEVQGTFGVSHIDLTVGKGFVYSGVGLGASVKGVYSSIDTVSTLGVGLDIGAIYSLAEPGIDLGISVKNIGFGLKAYVDSTEMFPFEITLSGVKLLEAGWFGLDLVKPALLGIGARIGGAYDVSSFLQLKASYSTLLSAVRSEGLGFIAGVTLGVGIRKDRFQLDYTYSPYFDLGGGHRISVGFGG